ncbi:MAG: hypothetical protein GY796_27190 [Chloroflexi bacterium]|nr:hypothetical protein [Chloroflexota bacterium]
MKTSISQIIELPSLNKKLTLKGMLIVFLLIGGGAFYFVIFNKSDFASTISQNEKCIGTFDEFAFPEFNESVQEIIHPGEPWQVEAAIPNISSPAMETMLQTLPIDNYAIFYELLGVRSLNQHTDVWVIGSYPIGDGRIFLVFQSDTQEWRQASVQEYDELKEEILYGWHEVSTAAILKIRTSHWDEVLLDSRGIFWGFENDDAVYSYNPSTDITERFSSLKGLGTINHVSLAPDDSIFFSYSGDAKGISGISQFLPITDEIKNIKLPIGSFFGGFFLVDSKGNLWLKDAYGWRASNENWHIMHPEPLKYWWNQEYDAAWRHYNLPVPIMESSDGRIWFQVEKSSNIKNYQTGLAWLNPQTNEGCWFTSEGGNIVEDLHHNLWLIADGRLYKYALTP